jgi:putative flippase GtrA
MAGLDPRFLRFCAVGATGVVVNIGVFHVARLLLAGSIQSDDRLFLAANVAGFLVSVFTNFLLNDAWTWRDRRGEASQGALPRLAWFYVVASVAGAVQISVAFLSRSWLPSWLIATLLEGQTDNLAVLFGIGVATIINYVVNNLWTFRATPA